MKTDPKVAKKYIEDRLHEKTTRPSTRATDNEAARMVARKEAEIAAMNKANEKLSRSISTRIFSTPKKGR